MISVIKLRQYLARSKKIMLSFQLNIDFTNSPLLFAILNLCTAFTIYSILLNHACRVSYCPNELCNG